MKTTSTPRPHVTDPHGPESGVTTAHRRANALKTAIGVVCYEMTRMVERAENDLGPQDEPCDPPDFDEGSAEELATALPDLFMMFDHEFKLAVYYDMKRAGKAVAP